MSDVAYTVRIQTDRQTTQTKTIITIADAAHNKF